MKGMNKEELDSFYLTLYSLRRELANDDPDFEAILYTLIVACMENRVKFSFEYWHLSEGVEPIRVTYYDIMWSFFDLEEAIRWTVDYAIKKIVLGESYYPKT